MELQEKQNDTNTDDINNASARWDYVILFADFVEPCDKNGNVLPETDHNMQKFREIQTKRKELMDKLQSSRIGLDVVQKTSADGKSVFLLITSHQERLEAEAERIKMPMLLKVY